MARRMEVTARYAAIGDSFTEGVGDELRTVRGRLLEPIVTDQLEAA